MRSVMAGAERKPTMCSGHCWGTATCVRLDGMSVCTVTYYTEGVCGVVFFSNCVNESQRMLASVLP